MIFQDYIKSNNDSFDVVWFLQCSDFSWVIDISKSYLSNFIRILKKDGLIIHMDWDGITKKLDKSGLNQPVGSLIPIDLRNKRTDRTAATIDKVNWFLKYIIPIETGVYRFKPILQMRLATMLLL